MASLFGNNYGISIVVLTIAIRLVIAPFMMKQYVKSFEMRKKMAAIKPEIDAIQMKLKEADDPKEKQKIQMEMMNVYRKHNINPLSSIGCLPIIIQTPVLMGFYFAIRGSKEIATHTFLWFNLGHPDLLLTLFAGVVYYLQFKVSQKMIPIPANDQQQSMQWIGLISPIMIVFASLSSPAVLPLYWSVGALFLIVQTFAASLLLERIEKRKAAAQNHYQS
ncbi:membrane protein insertase YidC [Sporolactobacillus sp. THM7-7]|nr:membrane protein insertase YidC [Sporolactobacillus sp. THM7-7]